LALKYGIVFINYTSNIIIEKRNVTEFGLKLCFFENFTKLTGKFHTKPEQNAHSSCDLCEIYF
jgi:hypothetical protein